MMRLVVGLGNPGKKYENTRHNVGFVVLDKLAEQIEGYQWKMDKDSNSLVGKINTSTILVKPQTFMNESGRTVSKISNYYKIDVENVLVVHDDMDILLGDYKLQKGKGPRDHNGILSIEESLGTRDFWRIRVGIENRTGGKRIEGQDYVLQKFDGEEREVVNGVTDLVVKKIKNDFL